MAVLFRYDGLMPGGLFGIPGPQILDNFLGAAAIFNMLLWFAAPLILGMLMRRLIKRLLNPKMEEWLRSASGIPQWGWLNRIFLHRRLPERD
jgi:hypothetical protein